MRPRTASVATFGTVTAKHGDGFTIDAGSAGYVPIYVSSSTKYSGPSPAAGQIAEVVGTGSTASSIWAGTVYTTTASSISTSGKVTAVITDGYTIYSSSFGYLHVFTNNSTQISGNVAAGSQVYVAGRGSLRTFIGATSISTSPGTHGGSGLAHVITADYLGAPWGTTKVAYAAAAPYLDWAETGTADSGAISAAGIKTMMYVDPNRSQSGTGDPMYTSDETTFAHDCRGARVYDTYSSSKRQYVMNQSASSMRALFSSYVKNLTRMGHIDALFEDDGGALSAFAVYWPFNAMPCDYSDSTWIAEEIGLNTYTSIPLIINGLSGLDGHAPSLALGLITGSEVLGGTYEQCYTSITQPKQDTWLWAAIEDTELSVVNRDKAFQCLGTNTTAAASATDARIYAYASFLLTYSPSTSIYRSEFATSTGLHVMPETAFVPTAPSIASPATISGLEQSGGTYARQYGACYLRGTLIGACAVVVNPDRSSSRAFPYPSSDYHHSLSITGSGVLDGGSVSASGSAPPSSLGPDEAVIALP